MRNLEAILVCCLVMMSSSLVSAASFDGDDYPDLITAIDYGNARGQLVWYENVNGVQEQRTITGYGYEVVHSLDYGDLDGDGYTDLFVGTNQGMKWYEARSDNTVTLVQSWTGGTYNDIEFYGNTVYAAKTGGVVEFTASADNTAALTNRVTDATRIYNAVNASDFDNDGKVELVLGYELGTNAAAGAVELRERQTDGSLTHISNLQTISGGDGFASGYYDDDTSMDIFISRFGNGTSQAGVVWYEADGTDNGLTYMSNKAYVHAQHLDLVDIDEDGNMDLIISDDKNGRTTWHESTADNTDGLVMQIAGYDQSGALCSGDWDQDGDVDLIYGSDPTGLATVWGEANGNNSWLGNAYGNGYIDSTVNDVAEAVLIIPEPATISLLGISALVLLRKKRKVSKVNK